MSSEQAPHRGRGPSRDFVGYGAAPPRITWPNGARLALSVCVNYEEGAEHSLLEGARREMSGEVHSSVPADMRDLVNESFFEYGSRVGVYRLLSILREAGVQATFFVCGMAAEKNPNVMSEVARGGHEICGHGYRWVEHHLLSLDDQRDDIRRCVEVLERITRQRPVGWLNRYAPSLDTRSLLAEEGGFIYDSNSFNDDLPYYVRLEGMERPWLVVPYSMELNDGRAWRDAMISPSQFEQFLVDAFDELYAESAEVPKMMSIGLHCRISGTPGRARALRRFLEYANGRPGVWFARRDEIARWFWENYPPTRLTVGVDNDRWHDVG